MGRLVGLPYFFSQEAFGQERTDSSDIRRARSSASAADVSSGDEEVQACQRLIAQRIQQQLDGHMLRRTTGSLNWKQEILINLPPYKEIAVVVKPTEREMTIISELADRVKERYILISVTVLHRTNALTAVFLHPTDPL